MRYFTALIKPASSQCNLGCGYCFYRDVAGCRVEAARGIMNFDTAEALMAGIFAYCGEDTQVSFVFQGGEPTLAGLDFFRNFCSKADSLNIKKLPVSYSIQTNGLLIDAEWCGFLKNRGFLVGLSLDGDKATHDRYRKTSRGVSTFGKTFEAACLMRKYSVDFNILTVVTGQTARRAQSVFHFLNSNGFAYVQFIPCLAPLKSGDTSLYLTPREYGAFLKDFFDLWYGSLRSGNRFRVRNFDNILMLLKGMPAEQCGSMGFCAPQFVVEADGSVYPCDFYCLDEYLAGNVNRDAVAAIAASKGVERFLEDSEPEHPLCAACETRAMCGGGCKRTRNFLQSEPGYCPLKDFFAHSLDRLCTLARFGFS